MRSYRPKAARIAGEPLFPDYPNNARSFIVLDAGLLPYWHMLFDPCPALLKLDPPEGLALFRRFMVWAYQRQPVQDWTFHISVCRWLLQSEYARQVGAEQIESLLCAAAARWASHDGSSAQGILLASSAYPMTLVEWKHEGAGPAEAIQVLPPARFDFAWSPLSGAGLGGFRRWLRIPE
ncbi:putative natural product biosynthesis protein [Pseudomonas sp. ABC1]|uniref:putative natural product biosynthesis protein n=1 Tax=Pseudomonas sp. ABC1 TaxID=2748080 RepID=UPI0015C30180|nr:putative natural product biosynthesis protein [Pseudomonas sp. ABC1]QLF93434.1 putative natural product biosynthesis protein [Pseudomonas sp. ABC1]